MQKEKYGCRYLSMNKKTYTERCLITGKEIKGEVLCDCDFEKCKHYRYAQKPIQKKNGQLPGQMSIDDLDAGLCPATLK